MRRKEDRAKSGYHGAGLKRCGRTKTGTPRITPGKLEDKSPAGTQCSGRGARIRIGTRVIIQGQREQFWATVSLLPPRSQWASSTCFRHSARSGGYRPIQNSPLYPRELRVKHFPDFLNPIARVGDFETSMPHFVELGITRHRMISANVTSASGPARSRRASPGVQRQRNASRHEA